jgi:hypothetical protein
VRAGNQKGRVERATRYVRDSFWAGRAFTTLAECNRQALLWRDQVAHQRRWPGGDHLTVAEIFEQATDYEVSKTMQAYFVNFIKTFNPNGSRISFIAFNAGDGCVLTPQERPGKAGPNSPRECAYISTADHPCDRA